MGTGDREDPLPRRSSLPKVPGVRLTSFSMSSLIPPPRGTSFPGPIQGIFLGDRHLLARARTTVSP